MATLWMAIILAQIGLGAWTVWSNKAADVATLHVVVGALGLGVGVLNTALSRVAAQSRVAPASSRVAISRSSAPGKVAWTA